MLFSFPFPGSLILLYQHTLPSNGRPGLKYLTVSGVYSTAIGCLLTKQESSLATKTWPSELVTVASISMAPLKYGFRGDETIWLTQTLKWATPSIWKLKGWAKRIYPINRWNYHKRYKTYNKLLNIIKQCQGILFYLLLRWFLTEGIAQTDIVRSLGRQSSKGENINRYAYYYACIL